MTLNDLFQFKEKQEKNPLFWDLDFLTKQDLEPFKNELLLCDEFSGVQDIVFVDMPATIIDGTTYMANTYLVSDPQELKFGPTFYLYSIAQTPVVYNPNIMYESVKDSIAIVPAYDEQTFKPKYKLILEFSPQELQDNPNLELETLLKVSHALKNKEQYKAKGQRKLIIRGFSI